MRLPAPLGTDAPSTLAQYGMAIVEALWAFIGRVLYALLPAAGTVAGYCAELLGRWIQSTTQFFWIRVAVAVVVGLALGLLAWSGMNLLRGVISKCIGILWTITTFVIFLVLVGLCGYYAFTWVDDGVVQSAKHVVVAYLIQFRDFARRMRAVD